MSETQDNKPMKAAKPAKPKHSQNKKKKKKGFVWNIRNKLLVSFLAVLLLPSLAVGLITLTMAEDGVQGQLVDSAMQSVSTANTIVESQVNYKIHDINYFADALDPTLIKGENDSPELQLKLEQYLGLHPDAMNIFVGTTDGVMVRGKPTASSTREML